MYFGNSTVTGTLFDITAMLLAERKEPFRTRGWLICQTLFGGNHSTPSLVVWISTTLVVGLL